MHAVNIVKLHKKIPCVSKSKANQSHACKIETQGMQLHHKLFSLAASCLARGHLLQDETFLLLKIFLTDGSNFIKAMEVFNLLNVL